MSPQSKPAALHLPRPLRPQRPARRVLTALVAGGVFLTGSGVASADIIYNTLDASIDATAEAMSLTAGGAVGTTQLKVDQTNDDGKGGCNFQAGETLKLALASSDTAYATVSPAEVTFSSCADIKDLTVTGVKATGTTPVTIRATQVSNNTGDTFDLAPVRFTVSVAAAATAPSAAGDTTAPEAPSIDLVAASDTGSSSTDNHTNDTTPTLTGTAEASSTVEVFDGATSLGTTTATSTGTWTFTPAAELTGTSHSFTAKAKDAANNVSAASAVLSVTIDSSIPVLPTIDLVAASDTGASSTDDITSDNTPTLSGTAEAGTVVNVFDGTTGLSETTAAADGKWSVTTGTLSDGVHRLIAQSTDRAGNTSESSLTLEVTTDTIKPDAPTIDLTASSDSGASDADNITKDATLTLTGTGIAGDTVAVSKSGDVVGGATVSSSGTWSFTTAALNDGTHSFTAAAKDTAGNTSDPSSVLSVLVDRTAPVVEYTSSVQTSNGAGWFKDDVTARFTATDAGSRIQQGTEQLTSVVRTATTTGEGTAVTVDSPAVSDVAGNLAVVVQSAAYKIDRTAPTVALGSSITADSSYVFGTVPAQPSCDASDGLSGLDSCTVTGYSTAVGTHTLTATAKDHAGNTATASRKYTVSPWTLKGLYQPVDMSGVLNTAKAGSTIPLKFEVFRGATELTDPATTVKSLTYISTESTSTLPTDEIETLATGSTALRYDSTSGQFIYNWKTPAAGSYRLTITMVDGSTLTALFKLR